MSTEAAELEYDPTAEIERWVKRMRRKAIKEYVVTGIVVATVISWTVELVQNFGGDDSWPSAAFLSALVLWCLKTIRRYRNQ
jgi:hypothetical protein